jgi:hypothetical protein
MKREIKKDENGILYYRDGGEWFSPTYERIKYLVRACPGYSITTKTELFHVMGKDFVKAGAKLTIKDQVFTGTAQQHFHDKNWGIHATQVAETKAVGRALGMAGIGIEFGFASFDEMSGKASIEDIDDVTTKLHKTLKHE